MFLGGGICMIPVDENDNRTSRVRAACERTPHALSEIQGSWHHAIKKRGSAHWDSCANPLFAVLLNVLLDFSSEKSAESRLSFHDIYLNTQLQGKVVFTFWFCFSLEWRGLGMKELMLRTDNRDDH